MNPTTAQEIALKFAKALDADDFDTAQSLLAEDCAYDTGKETIRGAAAVMAPYRSNGVKAKKAFDKIEYETELESVVEDRATILFIDRLTKGSHFHEFRCRQTVTVNPAGKITHIAHQENPLDRQRVMAFFQECGIDW